MRIKRLVWPRERIEHIARHGVTPDEVQEACFGRFWAFRTKSRGENPVYYVFGQTDAGRHLFLLPDGAAYPVTARPMTVKEKHQYQAWKNR